MARQDNGNGVSSGATDRTNAGGGSRPAAKKPVSMAIAYIAWFVTVVAGLIVAGVWQQLLVTLYAVLNLYSWGYAIFYDSVLVILGLIWVVFVLFTEALFRKGASKGATKQQFIRIFGAEFALLIIAPVIRLSITFFLSQG